MAPNYESNIPISIQQTMTTTGTATGQVGSSNNNKPPPPPLDHLATSNELESNASAYFASSIGCNYADLENLQPTASSQQQLQNNNSTSSSGLGGTGSSASSSQQQPIRVLQQQQQQHQNLNQSSNGGNSSNPWIRRNYGPLSPTTINDNYQSQQPQQQQPVMHHAIHISSNTNNNNKSQVRKQNLNLVKRDNLSLNWIT